VCTRLLERLRRRSSVCGLTVPPVSMSRYSLKPFTFSNGIRVPAGVYLSGDQYGAHHNAELYENPDVFNPWRFSSMRDDGESTKHQLVATSNDFLQFGHGRHAWYARQTPASLPRRC
jgi:cytochrome P450